jgi:hypothetical protein
MLVCRNLKILFPLEECFKKNICFINNIKIHINNFKYRFGFQIISRKAAQDPSLLPHMVSNEIAINSFPGSSLFLSECWILLFGTPWIVF